MPIPRIKVRDPKLQKIKSNIPKDEENAKAIKGIIKRTYK